MSKIDRVRANMRDNPDRVSDILLKHGFKHRRISARSVLWVRDNATVVIVDDEKMKLAHSKNMASMPNVTFATRSMSIDRGVLEVFCETFTASD